MKIGYFCNATNWENKKSYNQILEEIRDISTYCDANNWNSIWFTEHHFSHEGMEVCPNPLMIGTDIAARTKNIRIGQAANIITFWNPIRVAEDIALLDQLSKGRVDVGVGRGIYGREALNMNADADMRDQAKNFRLFEETLSIMKKAWTEKHFNHLGEFYTYPAPNFEWDHGMSPANSNFMNLETKILEKISVVPQPFQKPHPPLWQVVDSPSSIEWAAKNNINVIMWIPTVKSLKNRFKIYQEAKSEAEKRPVELGEGISLVRDMFIADTMEEAKEKAGEAMVRYMSWVCHWRGLGAHMDPGEELPKTKGKLDLLNYNFLHKRNMLFGTVDYVIEKIEELKSELNLQNLQVWSNFPGVKHVDCMKSIKLFTNKVMPHFKNKGTTSIKNTL
jgi:alkanesulfonate monooxygenase SsuD/methylene tetrahydromethanopterin reductase-like flavin-dependent oxidoreductase (luciferase family)